MDYCHGVLTSCFPPPVSSTPTVCKTQILPRHSMCSTALKLRHKNLQQRTPGLWQGSSYLFVQPYLMSCLSMHIGAHAYTCVHTHKHMNHSQATTLGSNHSSREIPGHFLPLGLCTTAPLPDVCCFSLKIDSAGSVTCRTLTPNPTAFQPGSRLHILGPSPVSAPHSSRIRTVSFLCIFRTFPVASRYGHK